MQLIKLAVPSASEVRGRPLTRIQNSSAPHCTAPFQRKDARPARRLDWAHSPSPSQSVSQSADVTPHDWNRSIFLQQLFPLAWNFKTEAPSFSRAKKRLHVGICFYLIDGEGLRQPALRPLVCCLGKLGKEKCCRLVYLTVLIRLIMSPETPLLMMGRFGSAGWCGLESGHYRFERERLSGCQNGQQEDPSPCVSAVRICSLTS